MIRAKTKMVLMTTAALTLVGWRLNQEASPGKHNRRMLLQYATYELSFKLIRCQKTCETIHGEVCSAYIAIIMQIKLRGKF